LINEIKESPLIIHKAMALPSGFSTTLSNPISIRLVLLALIVMPVTVLVLPFNVDGHRINPTTPTQDLPMLPPSSSRKTQQPQQQVPWMLTPMVLMRLPSSGGGLHQQ
jgi:hypothetical protein